MKKPMTTLSVLLIALSPVIVNAGNTTTTTKIKSLHTYGEDTGQLNNTIVIGTVSSTPGCESGFYISANDSNNNKNIMSLLLSAYHADSSVYIAGYTHVLGPRPAYDKYCKAHSVGLKK